MQAHNFFDHYDTLHTQELPKWCNLVDIYTSLGMSMSLPEKDRVLEIVRDVIHHLDHDPPPKSYSLSYRSAEMDITIDAVYQVILKNAAKTYPKEVFSMLEESAMQPRTWKSYYYLARIGDIIPARTEKAKDMLCPDELFDAVLVDDVENFNAIEKAHIHRYQRILQKPMIQWPEVWKYQFEAIYGLHQRGFTNTILTAIFELVQDETTFRAWFESERNPQRTHSQSLELPMHDNHAFT